MTQLEIVPGGGAARSTAVAPESLRLPHPASSRNGPAQGSDDHGHVSARLQDALAADRGPRGQPRGGLRGAPRRALRDRPRRRHLLAQPRVPRRRRRGGSVRRRSPGAGRALLPRSPGTRRRWRRASTRSSTCSPRAWRPRRSRPGWTWPRRQRGTTSGPCSAHSRCTRASTRSSRRSGTAGS